MSVLVIAALAAGAALGLLLVAAGLTGRPILEGVGAGAQRRVGGPRTARIASSVEGTSSPRLLIVPAPVMTTRRGPVMPGCAALAPAARPPQ